MHVNNIDWHITPFRSNEWYEIWRPALDRALAHGASTCYLTRNIDDPAPLPAGLGLGGQVGLRQLLGIRRAGRTSPGSPRLLPQAALPGLALPHRRGSARPQRHLTKEGNADRSGRLRAVAGTASFFVVAPGVVAGLVPWLITGWEVEERLPAALRVLGVIWAGVAVIALVHSFARFALEGLGTPSPTAPTRHLVVGGLYRHVRNPMYVAVLTIIGGQALLFGSLALVGYAAVLGAAFATFVRFYEEPKMLATYGTGYERYREAVPGWIPRLRPWREP